MPMSPETFDAAKGYKRVNFFNGRSLLDSELNELQEILANEAKILLTALFGTNPVILNYGMVTVSSDSLVFDALWRVAVNGRVLAPPALTLVFPHLSAGFSDVFVELLKIPITAATDPTLLNPSGGEAVAERVKWELTFQNHDTSGDPPPSGGASRETYPLLRWARTADNRITPLAGVRRSLAEGRDIVSRKEVTTGTYSVDSSDTYLSCTGVSGCAILLPPNSPYGSRLSIKDGGGAAGTSNLVISPQAGHTIDHAAAYTIENDNGSVLLVFDGFTNWEVN